jgi:hypothetical protein
MKTPWWFFSTSDTVAMIRYLREGKEGKEKGGKRGKVFILFVRGLSMRVLNREDKQ